MDRHEPDVLPAFPTVTFVTGSSLAILKLQETVREIALTDIPVLIVGESGTGKDACARLIHQLSPRNGMRFQKCNCASFDLPEQFRQCSQLGLSDKSPGTLYLDNVHELDPISQRLLLSILPDAEDADANLDHVSRVVSSATSSLESEVEVGRFRRELYFRLDGTCLRIPPLRERLEDIPLLTERFLNKHSAALRKNPPPLKESVIQALVGYRWPGNIRELENFARKAVLFGDFQAALDELQAAAVESRGPAGTAQGSSLKLAARAASKKAERELILLALERTHWNRKRAARDLQISYKSLLYKIKQIGVSGGNSER